MQDRDQLILTLLDRGFPFGLISDHTGLVQLGGLLEPEQHDCLDAFGSSNDIISQFYVVDHQKDRLLVVEVGEFQPFVQDLVVFD